MTTTNQRTEYCRFAKNGSISYGIVEGDQVRVIDGHPINGYQITNTRHARNDIELLVPIIPNTFYAIGSNYHGHIIGQAKKYGVEPHFYDAPRVGYRANSALLAHEGNIVKPAAIDSLFEYEGELVAVIGKTGRNLTPEQANDIIFGWTIGNDVSARKWTKGDVTNLRGKNTDTFKPMGPSIVTGVDLRDMTTNVSINGKRLHSFPTGNMLFSPGEVISSISKNCTLSPGDVVWLGTDDTPITMKPGDLIEIEITGIGTLRNRVVAEKAN